MADTHDALGRQLYEAWRHEHPLAFTHGRWGNAQVPTWENLRGTDQEAWCRLALRLTERLTLTLDERLP